MQLSILLPVFASDKWYVHNPGPPGRSRYSILPLQRNRQNFFLISFPDQNFLYSIYTPHTRSKYFLPPFLIINSKQNNYLLHNSVMKCVYWLLKRCVTLSSICFLRLFFLFPVVPCSSFLQDVFSALRFCNCPG